MSGRTESEKNSMNGNPKNPRQDPLRDARKQITRSLLLALAAMGVVVFACYAWFVSNSSVTGSLMSVKINGSKFELASVGNQTGIFDARLPDTDQAEGEIWEPYGDGRITDSYTTILWRVSEASGLGNHAGGSGIEPGSSGTLQFYIVPTDNSPLDLTLSLELIPLIMEEGKFAQLSDPTAQDFMKGHLLVRYRLEGETASTLVNPELGYFPLTVGADPVLVSLDWSWPYLLKDALVDAEVASIISRSPKYFLYDGTQPVTEAFTIPEQNDPLFRKYSNYYNNADQYLGASVYAVLLRLTAEE